MRIASQVLLRTRHPHLTALSRQRGVSMAVVLMSLVVMGLAAVGLTRMIDTGTLIMGNLAFKQNTTSSTDRGMEDALNFLRQTAQLNPNDLYSDDPGKGYYAFARPLLDATWSGGGSNRFLPGWNDVTCAGASGIVTQCLQTAGENEANNDGTQVRYLIIRLCNAAGDHTLWTLPCVRPLANQADYARPAGALDNTNIWTGAGAAPSPIFRVIVRATGPRNTVSYTDTYVQF